MAIDIQSMAIPLSLMAAIIFAVAMFAVRKVQNNEPFDIGKMLQTLGVGALTDIFLYVTTGVVPGFEDIIAQMVVLLPEQSISLPVASAMLFGIVEYFLKGKLLISTPIIPSVESTKTATKPAVLNPYNTPAAATEQGIHSGPVEPKIDENRALPMSVALYPPYFEGVSPMDVTLGIDANPRTGPDAAVKYIVDFGDGSPVFDGMLNYGQAFVRHIYKWTKGSSDYTGKTFYPTISIVNVRGDVLCIYSLLY